MVSYTYQHLRIADKLSIVLQHCQLSPPVEANLDQKMPDKTKTIKVYANQ